MNLATLPSKASSSFFTIEDTANANFWLRTLFATFKTKSKRLRSSLLKTLNQMPRRKASNLSLASMPKSSAGEPRLNPNVNFTRIKIVLNYCIYDNL
jgi:hypothetical protein